MAFADMNCEQVQVPSEEYRPPSVHQQLIAFQIGCQMAFDESVQSLTGTQKYAIASRLDSAAVLALEDVLGKSDFGGLFSSGTIT